MNLRIVFPALAIIAGLASASCSKTSTGTAAEATDDREAAPVWTLSDVNGNPVSSESFKGKVVVVDFWTTWCPPCREEIPHYVEMQKQLGPEGLVIVGISLDARGPSVVKPFMEKFGINYTVVMDDGEVSEAFGGIEAIPTTFVIDRQGRIASKKIGYETREQFQRRILPLL